MNSQELKNLAVAYKKVSDSLMQASNELAKIEKMLATNVKKVKTTKKTKQTKKTQKTSKTFENELIQEIKKSNELVKKALE
jgi:hypothetical protein